MNGSEIKRRQPHAKAKPIELATRRRGNDQLTRSASPASLEAGLGTEQFLQLLAQTCKLGPRFFGNLLRCLEYATRFAGADLRVTRLLFRGLGALARIQGPSLQLADVLLFRALPGSGRR